MSPETQHDILNIKTDDLVRNASSMHRLTDTDKQEILESFKSEKESIRKLAKSDLRIFRGDIVSLKPIDQEFSDSLLDMLDWFSDEYRQKRDSYVANMESIVTRFATSGSVDNLRKTADIFYDK